MALFGEIIEPSSRALCDFEDDLDVGCPVSFIWEGASEPPSDLSLLICVEGKPLIDLFHKSVLHQSKLISACKSVQIEIHQIDTINDKKTEFVCLLGKSDRFYDAEIVDALRPWIEKATQVLSFVTQKMVDYQTRLIQEKPSILLRMLQVSSLNEISNNKFNIPLLEQPNIVTGKAAAVIAYRMHLDLSGVLFISYLDQSELDSVTAQPILSILNQINIPNISYAAGPLKQESNLYL